MVTPDQLEFLQRLYQNTSIGLCLFDQELRYLQINSWLARINGLSIKEHLGRRIVDILPQVAKGVEKQLRAVIETGEPVIKGIAEVETPAHPGEKRWYEHTYSPVRSEDGAVTGVSCVVEDITAQKHAAD